MKKRWDVNGCYYNDDEIKVGEYVRTIDGFIGEKTKDGLRKDTIELEDNVVSWITNKSIIAKHSEDIAELIGYGDFINGKMCIDIEHYTRDDRTKGINFVCIGGSVLKENIKSIVTKEQFESIEFKVEE